METKDDPKLQEQLRFQPISLGMLKSNAGLVSGSLAAQGKYLYPTIITADKQAKGTFTDAIALIDALNDEKNDLLKAWELKRSISPVSGEINNGGKEKINQKASLFEAACAMIATITEHKPSALIDGNTGIFPDLAFPELVEFAMTFMLFQNEGKTLLTGKPTKDKKFRRPPLHDGNYLNALREKAFGAVGLLAAMGYWALRVDDTTRQQTRRVLDSLKDCPIYLIGYSGNSQVRFNHFVVEMAKQGNLHRILLDFYIQAQPYSTLDDHLLRRELPVYRLMYFGFNRFLQLFNPPAFQDFLATRAEYPPSFNSLLGAYFMQSEKIPESIVESARILGQWINNTAYWVAEEDTDKNIGNRQQAVRKAKAKVLVEFESAILSAESPTDMLHRISTRAGRLLQRDAPPEAAIFYDAAAIGEQLSPKQAQHLVIAYLRLRAMKQPEDPKPTTETVSASEHDTDDDSELADKGE